MLLRKWLRMWWVGWLLNRWCLPAGTNPPCFSHLALLNTLYTFQTTQSPWEDLKAKGIFWGLLWDGAWFVFPRIAAIIQMTIYPEIMDICLLWWWLNGAQICSRTFWATHQDSIGRAGALCTIACISLPLGLLRSWVPGGSWPNCLNAILINWKMGPPSPDSVRGPFPTKFTNPVSADTLECDGGCLLIIF